MNERFEKALSVKQPWAWAVADGHKSIETRTWPTQYRGDLVIVSSLKPDKQQLDYLMRETKGKIADKMLYGHAIAIADLVDCRLMVEADEDAAMCKMYAGAHSWVFENVRKIKPFKQKGALGIYQIEIPYELDEMFEVEFQQPKMECPECHDKYDDFDGQGVIYCSSCGFCRHMSVTDGVCDYCDKKFCNCGKIGKERIDKGLACGVHCDACFEDLVADCREGSW